MLSVELNPKRPRRDLNPGLPHGKDSTYQLGQSPLITLCKLACQKDWNSNVGLEYERLFSISVDKHKWI